MIKSMTGYGRTHQDSPAYDVTVEVKSLNSKYLDASIRLPRLFGEYEIDIRKLLSQKLQRGKVSLNVDFRGKGELGPEPSVNQDLLKSYYRVYQQVAQELKDSKADLFKLSVQSPDVLQPVGQETADSDTWLAVRKLIEEAVLACDDFRRQEGASIKEDFEKATRNIADSLTKVKEQVPVRDHKLREKLRAQAAESFAKEVDENRFEQELIYYLEKLDINEEIVRLANHLQYFNEVVDKASVHGKKLGFIAQEIGREINTIGSKANDATIQHLVVGMKENLEKIKEQTLNVL